MLQIGLTGMIASGKSAAAGFLREQGVYCMDADHLWRQLMRPGQPGFKRLVRQFGKEILRGGQIDREKLRRAAFTSRATRRLLERLAHPLILKAYQSAIKRRKEWAVCLEAALILQTPSVRSCFDYIIVVKSHQRLRLKRLLKRKLPRELAVRILQDQEKRYRGIRNFANLSLVNNSGSMAKLNQALLKVLAKIKKAG